MKVRSLICALTLECRSPQACPNESCIAKIGVDAAENGTPDAGPPLPRGDHGHALLQKAAARSQRSPRRRFAPAGHDEAAAAFAEEAGLDPDPKHASLQSRGVVRQKTDFFGFLSRKKRYADYAPKLRI